MRVVETALVAHRGRARQIPCWVIDQTRKPARVVKVGAVQEMVEDVIVVYPKNQSAHSQRHQPIPRPNGWRLGYAGRVHHRWSKTLKIAASEIIFLKKR